jgi:D-alanyl-D-alanine carboxypeptidase (penicillin-binding protein 5/6)
MLRPLIRAACLLVLLALPAQAAFETRATAAWVYDVGTQTVLLEKNADTPLPPASMSKLMTLNMLFEAIRENPSVSLDTPFTVSGRSQAMGGSTMMLQQGDRPTAEDLIKGVIVQSGNDATVAIAEGLAGTEEAFARLMTDRARDLGMENSTFVNASGWPADGHRMSMRDLGILSTRLITEFPDFYTYFIETEYHYAERAPANRFNRNPILGLGIGADGLKTGHTREAGFGLAGSAQQGDRRVVFIITGLDSATARAEESERIVNWAFRQFVARDLVEAGTRMAEAPVFMGAADTVGLVAADDLTALVPLSAGSALDAEIRFNGPLQAPVLAGTLVGEIIITIPDMPERRIGLRTQDNVEKGGFTQRLWIAAQSILDQILGSGAADAAVR